MAAASLLNNAVALVFTLVFTRQLGTAGYGSLAALVSATVILLVAGQALQLATARAVALGQVGGSQLLAHTVSRWTRRLLLGALALTAVCVAARDPLADAIGVTDHPWAAAAVLPTGGLWLVLSVQRGALQGLRALRPVAASLVGESLGRLAAGLALVSPLGVTGAFLGTPVAAAVTSLVLGVVLRQRLCAPASRAHGHADPAPLRSLGELAWRSWWPGLALAALAALQNLDVIVARHRLGAARAGSYAAAAVSARAVVWVALGLGLHLLPEALERNRAGLDARGALVRALAVLAAMALPALAIFAAAAHPLLALAFGSRFTHASAALPLLGAAMTLLAASYLAAQYLLALGRRAFLAVPLTGCAVEAIILGFGRASFTGFAMVVLAVQGVVAGALLAAALTRRSRPR